jgi:diguanylate cyclase (GGDEF)-like protein/PAS domain S-box-containing protein
MLASARHHLGRSLPRGLPRTGVFLIFLLGRIAPAFAAGSPLAPDPERPAAWWFTAFLIAVLAIVFAALLRMRRRLRVSESSLARAAAEWAQALDFAEDALYVVDLNERVVRANRAFYRFLGREPHEVIGQNVMQLIHGAHEQEPCPVCQARLERRDAVFVKEADAPMNRWKRPLEIIVKIIRDARGEPLGTLMALRDLTRQREIERAIRDSEQRFRSLSQAAFEGIAIHDQGQIIDVNQTLAGMVGYEPAELVGSDVLGMVAPSSRADVMKRLRQPTDKPWEIEICRRDGTTFTAEIRARDFPYRGRSMRVVAVRDITELKRAQQALFEEKERLTVTFRSIGDAVIVTDVAGRVQYLNPVAEKFLDCEDADVRDMELSALCRIVDEADRQVPIDLVRTCLERGVVVRSRSDCLFTRRDGREFAVEHSAGPIRDRHGNVIGVVLALRDVSEMRRLARQLSHQASHDSLTGLLNRREFERRLDYALQSAKDDNKQHVLCYLDLDQFKVVNDTCGHVAGDQLLMQIAALIAPKVRDSDTLARLGGDEFGVLLEGCSLSKALEIAETLRQVVMDFRFAWGGRTFDVGVSIGVAVISADSGSVTEVLSAADAACYVAKDLGRNRLHVHQPDDVALARHRSEMEWAQRLSGAIKEDRLRLYGQPIVALQSGNNLVRHEILVHMLDEDGGIVPPMAFIPAAERYNLMPSVDRWVLSETLSWMRRTSRIAAPMACCVNLSGRSLCDQRFHEFVMSEIRDAGVDPAHIVFEITETAAVANFAQAQQFIAALKRLGCRFALDDFGSGLSSFAYLKHLPVDYLKIDGNFVRDMASDPVDYAMVEAINHLGHVMGIRTIAEYVETQAVLEKLRTLGVDYAQGFAISHPLPLDKLIVTPGAVSAGGAVS